MRRSCALGIAAFLSAAPGCSWQQAYYASQTWQRNACQKLVESIERERCLAGAGLSYDDYRRRSEGAKKE